jgi:hypothetical protein
LAAQRFDRLHVRGSIEATRQHEGEEHGMAMVALHESAPFADVDGSAVSDVNADPLLEPGTRVEVKRRFDAKWSRGFEVLDHASDGYRLVRLSDGTTLPVPFGPDDVRPERRNNSWWI